MNPLSERNQIFNFQHEISKAGWQWMEHIYNDGSLNDCYITLTKNTDPSYFIEKSGELGWGRFPRLQCWSAAYQFIIVEKNN